ncbi:ATP-binding protein [Peribacillus loiseleuriae]|uniref:ATP-binding protein n=1 Tax=Peribacillus loiseleuriae TaxID=1679170 RepID=UPI003818D9E8
MGVNGHQLSSIFEPFYRVDQSRSKSVNGNGLGLTIVKTAIVKLGGNPFLMLKNPCSIRTRSYGIDSINKKEKLRRGIKDD